MLEIGPTRSGKSWRAWEGFLAWSGYGMYLDPKGTDPYIQEAAERGDVAIFHTAQEFFDANPRPRKAVLQTTMTVDFAGEAEAVLDYVIQFETASMQTGAKREDLLVLDEAWAYAQKQSYKMEDVQRIIASGRGAGLSTVLICQHPNTVPNDAIQNMDLIMVWAAHPPSGTPAPHYITVEWWEEHFGPFPPYADTWLRGAEHRALATDHSAIFCVDPEGVMHEAGTLSRDAVEEEEPPAVEDEEEAAERADTPGEPGFEDPPVDTPEENENGPAS